MYICVCVGVYTHTHRNEYLKHFCSQYNISNFAKNNKQVQQKLKNELIMHSALYWLSLYVNSLGAHCKSIFTYRIKTKYKWIHELNIENLSDITYAMKSFFKT